MIHPTWRAAPVVSASLRFAARAQDWAPHRPVRLINPFAPGGSAGILARGLRSGD